MRQFISFISLMFFLSVSFTVNAVSLKAYTGNITNPVLVLKDLNGIEHNLEQYRGSIVLVQFWATYCTPCRKEMPSMNNMQKKLKFGLIRARMWLVVAAPQDRSTLKELLMN